MHALCQSTKFYGFFVPCDFIDLAMDERERGERFVQAFAVERPDEFVLENWVLPQTLNADA